MPDHHKSTGSQVPVDLSWKQPTTLAELLVRAASGDHGSIYIGSDGRDRRRSYKQLLGLSGSMACGLKLQNLKPGSAVILQAPENELFYAALQACFQAGLVAVPVAVPDLWDSENASLIRLQQAWEMLDHAPILTSVSLAEEIKKGLGKNATILTDEMLLAAPDSLHCPAPAADGIALMMLTSGSTGRPKLVTQTHQAILAQARGQRELLGLTENEVFLNWIPSDHVGSLIMIHTQALFLGASEVHVNKQAILDQPLLWLDLMDRYRASFSWAPCFAYGLINRELEEGIPKPWDLSCLRYLLNGGEMIAVRTPQRFAELLAPCGLGPDVVRSAYGMSEICSGVTYGTGLVSGCRTDPELALLGRPIPGLNLRIVDADNRPLGEGDRGRLQVSGPMVTAQYYRNPQANAQAFSDGWFDTGDCGFLEAGQLVLSGRDKQDIIINGINYHSVAIESAAETVPGVTASFTAACPVRLPADTSEKLAIFLHLDPSVNPSQVLARVRKTVQSRVGVNPSWIIPLEMDLIPKTEIGKIQRKQLARSFMDGEFAEVVEQARLLAAASVVPPKDELERSLVAIWRSCLRQELLGVKDSFFNLGGSSLEAGRLLSQVRERLGCKVPTAVLFQKPTIEAMATWIRQNQGHAEKALPQPMLLPRAEQGMALSFAQRQLWPLARMRPGAAYNLPVNVEIKGKLDAEALVSAFRHLIQCHEILRTVYKVQDDEPRAFTLPDPQFVLESEDLGQVTVKEQVQALSQQAHEFLTRPFDLEADLPIRARLVRVGPQHYHLLTTVHHVAMDGQSIAEMSRQLSRSYGALVRGQQLQVPVGRIQYADFAQWQHQLGEEGFFDEATHFWKGHLRDLTPLELPFSLQEPQNPEGEQVGSSFQLSEAVTRRLRQLGRTNDATLFMICLAAFHGLLARYSGQNQIITGTAVHGRALSLFDDLLGCFVNTIALKGDLSGKPGFHQLLERTRNLCLEAFAHQDLPFEKLVGLINPDRVSGQNPIFQVMFTYQVPENLAPLLDHSELETRAWPFDGGVARYDLECHVWEDGPRLRGHLLGNPQMYNQKTLARITQHFCCFLEVISMNSDLPVHLVPLLSRDEEKQLEALTRTSRPLPAGGMLGLFQQVVANSPESTAMILEKENISYADLDAAANRVAWSLRQNGVGSETRVGLFFERSAGAVVAILAILKAGGTYVPLDPAFPPERLDLIIQQTRMEQILTSNSLRERLPVSACQILFPDEDLFHGDNPGPPIVETDPQQAAYIMYTSGSTGQPKGITVPQQGISRLVTNTNFVDISAEDTLLLFAPLAFDASTFEIWGALLNGAALAIYPPALGSLSSFGSFIAQKGVTTLWLTAGFFNEMVDEKLPQLALLKQVLTGGDVLSPAHVARFHQIAPETLLINGYGPTENTTFTCCHPISEFDPEKAIPIGRPISNTSIYILDADGNRVAPGIRGELFCGGLGLARGYDHCPGLTAEKFVPNPFAVQPGERLYRTGDLVSLNPEDQVSFHGRVDRQLKIRGFRIEPGEIEAVLCSHSKVRNAVVVLDQETSKRLLVYVVSKAGESELKDWLSTRLPTFMLPDRVIPLDSLPLGPTGKVNLAELPRPGRKTGRREPQTRLEQQILDIWKAALQLVELGVQDNFFDLGGHSLLGIRVMSDIERLIGSQVQLETLFENPTVAMLAETLSGSGTRTWVSPVSRTDAPAPLSFAQRRLWVLDQISEVGCSYNIPLNLRLSGRLNVAALKQSLKAVVDRHDVLRTHIHEHDNETSQFKLDISGFEIEQQDLSNLSVSEREDQLRLQADFFYRSPFNLRKDFPFRARLLQMGSDQWVLLLTVHHIAFDNWSIDILARELSLLYRAFNEGLPDPLEPLSFRYSDFSWWQHQQLTGAYLERLLHYWTTRLEHAPQLLLPTDRPRPEVMTFAASWTAFAFSPQLTRAVEKYRHDTDTTWFMVLMAGFQALLARYTGQEKIIVGTPIANRDSAGADKLIGFFVNSLALCGDLSGDPDFNEITRRTRRDAYEAFAHREMPFEKLVENLLLPRLTDRNPLFQVTFSVLEREPDLSQFQLAEVKVETMEWGDITARFDLEMHIWLAADQLQVRCVANRSLFDPESVERMMADWVTLMEQAVSAPETPLSQLLPQPTSQCQYIPEEPARARRRGPQPLISSDIEKVIARLWRQILEVQPTFATDNFFEMGGHSLAAMKLSTRLHKIFKIDLPVMTLFKNPTVETMAGALKAMEIGPGQLEKAAGLWLAVESMSPEEVMAMLMAQQRGE